MRVLAEAVPPVGPVTLPALAALFALCALIVAIGLIKLLDAFVRAMFGTISGAVGWIPFAGKVVARDVHKIEQKISYGLGSAERKLDAGVAWTWNNCAHLVAYVGTEIEGLAKGSWHIAQQLKGFVTPARLDHVVRGNVKPVTAKVENVAKAQRADHAHGQALAQSVAQGVYPRLRAEEHAIADVLSRDIAALRSRTKALEHDWHAVFKWLQRYKTWILGATFVGAVDLALKRLGGGWIRCKNWRNIGKTVCRLPTQVIEALLGLGLAFGVVIDPVATAHLAADVTDGMDGLIRKIAD